ncbi:MAG: hypothetical protein GF335_00210 [Candidatus Moranbacteria bacterium]|nr:hypothetical protein [Candidatus Moranbacteria bacterium]
MINDKEYFLFTPLLVYLFREKKNKNLIKQDLKNIFADFKIFKEKINKIDFNKKQLYGDKRCFSYDYLLIATGAKTNFLGIRGAKDHAFGLKSLQDFERIDKRIKRIKTSKEKNAIVIAGGGPTGVETAIEISQTLKMQIDQGKIKILVVDKNQKPLNNMDKYLSKKAQDTLRQNKIKFLKNKKIVEVGKNFLKFNNGKQIESDLIIWTIGVKPKVLNNSGNQNIDLKKGFLQNQNLLLKGEDRVFVAGDAAFAINPKTSKPYPSLAQLAKKQGSFAAKNMIRLVNNKFLKEFNFNQKGLIIPLGNKKAAAKIFGLKVNGRLAAILWKWVYVLNFPTLRKKIKLIKKLFF